MAKKTKKFGDTIDTASRPPIVSEFPQLIDVNSGSLATFARASEALITGMGLVGLAMMQFASTRLRENMELSESALQCGDASEAFSLQCNHAKTATQQYVDQASKLMGLTVQISERSVAPLQDAARETLDRLTQR
jgi:hypothetical protein